MSNKSSSSVITSKSTASSTLPSIQKDNVESLLKQNVQSKGEQDPRLVELKIERNRIIDILGQTLVKATIAMGIDQLTDDQGAKLKKPLLEDELSYVLTACSKYKPELRDTTYVAEMAKQSYHERCYNTYFDPDLTEALNMLYQYPAVIDLCHKTINDEECIDFILGLEKFIDHFKQILNLSAPEECGRENYLREIWNKNVKAKEKIELLNIKMTENMQKFSHSIHKKENYVKDQEERIDSLYNECVSKIQNKIFEVERQMANDWHTSVDKQQELKERQKHVSNEYDSVLRKHLQEERQSRAKRVRVETQLLNRIEQYDQDMIERQDKYDVLMKKFENEMYELQELQDRMENERPIYEQLMQEREEYREECWRQAVYEFIINTAARHIQRWYRRIMADYKARRKALLKSMKKGKKSKSPPTPTIVKSAPPVLSTKLSIASNNSQQQSPHDSRRASISSRRSVTAPIGVTKIQTETRDQSPEELKAVKDKEEKLSKKFDYVSTFFKGESNADDSYLY